MVTTEDITVDVNATLSILSPSNGTTTEVSGLNFTTVHVTTTFQTPAQDQEFPQVIIIGIAAGAAVLLLLIAILITILCLRKKRTKSDTVHEPSDVASTTYKQLVQKDFQGKDNSAPSEINDNKETTYVQQEVGDKAKKTPLKPKRGSKATPTKPARKKCDSENISGSSNGDSLTGKEEVKEVEEEQSDYVNVVRDQQSGRMRPKTKPRTKRSTTASCSSDSYTPCSDWLNESNDYEVPKTPVPVPSSQHEYLTLLPAEEGYVNGNTKNTDTTNDLYVYADSNSPSPCTQNQSLYENA